MDPVGPADPFGPYLFADCVRLTLAAVGVFMVLLVAKVAWMRYRSAEDDPLRERSPAAMVSYAAFCIIPTGHALQFIGREPDWGLIVWFAFALGTGVWAVFGQVTIRLWWRPKHRAGRRATDTTARSEPGR